MIHRRYGVLLVMCSAVSEPNVSFGIIDKKVQPWSHWIITSFPYKVSWAYEECGDCVTCSTQTVLARNSCRAFSFTVGLLEVHLPSFLFVLL